MDLPNQTKTNRELIGLQVLSSHAEAIYALAARAAAERRVSNTEKARTVAMAGTIVHSCIDAIADSQSDQHATIANLFFAIQTLFKLDIKPLEAETQSDLELLQKHFREGRNKLTLAEFPVVTQLKIKSN